MGRQLNFYADPQLENQIIDYILSQKISILIQGESHLVIIESKESYQEYSHRNQIYFYREDFGQLIERKINDKTIIEVIESQCIEFHKTTINEK